MSEYDQYVTAVNKIFENITKLKTAIKNTDNLGMIENIEQYKQVLISSANLFSKEKKLTIQKDDMEELGND